MKRFLLVISVLALAGCMKAEPSPAFVQMQSACQAGDLEACAVVMQAEAAAEQRKSEVMAAMLFGGSSSTTNCYGGGNWLNCTTY